MQSKRQMRREVSVLCLIFVLYMAITGLIGGFAALTINATGSDNIFGFTNEIVNRMEMTAYLGTYILMLVAPLGVFFIVKSKEKTTDYFYVNRAPKLGATFLGCVGILAINYVFTIISDAGSVVFSRVGVLADVSELLTVGDDPVCNVLYFVILVVAPAILEEFCYRGVICGRLIKYNRTAAVLISSILFSLIHMNFDQIPFAFAAGLLMGYVYVRTGSIWSTVIIHAVNNGFAYFSEYLFYEYDSAMSMQQLYMIGWAAVFIVGLVCLVILGLSHKDADDEQPIPCGQALAAGSGSALFIICCSLALAASVLVVPLS
jgi:membrane protease YdiL (CAAX protease family)